MQKWRMKTEKRKMGNIKENKQGTENGRNTSKEKIMIKN